MKKDTAFGTGPEHLRRLFALGLDGSDEQDQAAAIEAWDLCREKPGSQIGRYRLLGILGEGGMGIVYQAEQQQPVRRQVALKIIKPGMDSRQVVARFEAERQTLALLDHPHIAHVLDAGTTDSGLPYFVMEYVEGLPITDYCDQNKLGIEDRLRLFVQVCQAVHYAHQKGFIHRDIKPSNILVAVQDGQPIPKVIDFGVARALDQALTQETLSTQEGQLIGTPEYMSPEQIELADKGADTRSDVYSLGVLLYVLLTGVLPFESEAIRGGGLEHLRRVVREQDPKTPSTRLTILGGKATEAAANRRTNVRTLARDLHRELEWIPLKAMRKEREQRYQSAAELAQDVRNYLDGAPLIAGPPSASYRLRKFVKRNRMKVSLIGLATVVIGIGVGIGSILYIRSETRARQSQALSSLLNNTVLYALDPTRTQGGEVTALSVLNAVSESLEGRFRDAPLIEASVRHRLGVTYCNHDECTRATQQLERALDIRRHRLGENDPLTISSMFELGVVHYYAGRHDKAEPLLLEVLGQRTRQLGEGNSQTLLVKHMLALTCASLGDHDRQMELSREILQTARRIGDSRQTMAMWATYSIGSEYAHLGDCDEAEKWLCRAVQLEQEMHGQDTASMADLLAWLGLVYVVQGRYPEAESTLKESMARGSRILGEHHWDSLQPLQHLVRLYVAWDKPEVAVQWRTRLEASLPSQGDSQPGGIRYDETTGTYTLSGRRSSAIFLNHVLDEFHFAWKTLNSDGTITARIDSIDDADPWSHAGIMIRNTREPTSAHTAILVRSCGTVEFWHRAAERGVARHVAVRSFGLPRWVRLTRRGNTFTAQHSSDGICWEDIQSRDPNQAASIEVVMNETVSVGPVVASSYHPGSTPRAEISNVTLTGSINPDGPFTTSKEIALLPTTAPSGGQPAMVGTEPKGARTPALSDTFGPRSVVSERTPWDMAALATRYGRSAGSIWYEGSTDTYTIVGAGKDIWSRSDEFHFSHKTLTGDGSITTRIDSVQPVNLWTKAGVMIRNTLASDSVYAAVFVTPSRRVTFQYRPTAGQDTLGICTDPNAVTLPHWLRLIREGNLFMAQHSQDGRIWKDLEGADFRAPGLRIRLTPTEIPMSELVHVGLAVSSHAALLPAEARMSHVVRTGAVQPPGEFLWSEDIGFQMILLPKK